MEIDNRIFTKDKIEVALIKFAVPAMISLLVMELYNMVDTVFAGIAIGPKGIGALTIAFPIQRLISALALMIATGGATFVARYLGKKDYSKLNKVIINSINITIIIMIFLTTTTLLFKEGIIKHFLGASELIYPYAHQYISIIIFGGIFQALTLVMCYIMTSLGYTNITLKSTSIGALLNIIVDYILVVKIPMGIKGTAIATVSSQVVAFVYALYKFKKVCGKVDLTYKFNLKSCIEKSIVGSILAVGFATFIIEISDAVVAVILNNLLYMYGGDNAVVMIGTTTKVSMFLFITVTGISSAMQPIAAYNYGAKDFEKVKKVVIKTILGVTIATTILWVLMFGFSKEIIGIFLKEKYLLEDTVKAFKIIISVFPLIGIYYVCIYYYQSMGRAKTSLILSVYRQIIIFIPVLFLLVSKFHIMGAWLAFPVSDLISAFTGVIYTKKAIKETIQAEKIYKDKKNKLNRTKLKPTESMY